MGTIFNSGKPQTIENILASKDERVKFQSAVLQNNKQSTLIDMKMNIPGPIKNNDQLERLFDYGMQKFINQFQVFDSQYEVVKQWNRESGNEVFILSQLSGSAVKKNAINFEDNFNIGRLFDVDVLTSSRKQSLSRSLFGYTPRKCFICDHPAKECARSRKHSVTELQSAISNLYDKIFRNEENSNRLINCHS